MVLALFPKALMADTLDTDDLPATVAAQDRVALCVDVDDVDAVAEQVVSHGVALDMEPVDVPAWMLRVAHFRDPDGHLIEINKNLPVE